MSHILKQGGKQPRWTEFACFYAVNTSPQGPARTDLPTGRESREPHRHESLPCSWDWSWIPKSFKYICAFSDARDWRHVSTVMSEQNAGLWNCCRSGRIQPSLRCCPTARVLRVHIIDNVQILAVTEVCKHPWLSGSVHESSVNGRTTENCFLPPYPIRIWNSKSRLAF